MRQWCKTVQSGAEPTWASGFANNDLLKGGTFRDILGHPISLAPKFAEKAATPEQTSVPKPIGQLKHLFSSVPKCSVLFHAHRKPSPGINARIEK